LNVQYLLFTVYKRISYIVYVQRWYFLLILMLYIEFIDMKTTKS